MNEIQTLKSILKRYYYKRNRKRREENSHTIRNTDIQKEIYRKTAKEKEMIYI